MSAWRGRFVLVLLVILLTTREGKAQQLTPFKPFPSASLLASVADRDEGPHRFSFAAYMVQWEIPLNATSGSATRPELQTDTGVLLTGDILILPNLSIGGWWNRLESDLVRTGRGIPNGRIKLYDVETTYWDVHMAFRAPEETKWGRGLSFQVGYTAIHYDLDVTKGVVGGTNTAFTLDSPSLWLNKTQEVWHLTIGHRPYPLTFFGSVGYFTARDFDNDWNLIVGVSIGLTRHLSLTSSVWFNGLDEDRRTRVTAGISGSF